MYYAIQNKLPVSLELLSTSIRVFGCYEFLFVYLGKSTSQRLTYMSAGFFQACSSHYRHH